jgi:hypothetical protein
VIRPEAGETARAVPIPSGAAADSRQPQGDGGPRPRHYLWRTYDVFPAGSSAATREVSRLREMVRSGTEHVVSRDAPARFVLPHGRNGNRAARTMGCPWRRPHKRADDVTYPCSSPGCPNTTAGQYCAACLAEPDKRPLRRSGLAVSATEAAGPVRGAAGETRPAEPFLVWLKANGVELPVAEYRFAPPRKWRFDWAWPDHRVALEVEGGAFVRGRHNRPDGFVKDIEKYSEATARGWRLIRCTPAMLCTERTLGWITRTLQSAAA